MSRVSRTALVVVAMAVLVSACASANAASRTPKHESARTIAHHADLLFVARGDAAVAGNQLTLATGSTPVTWITDRPNRVAGHLSGAALVAGWKAAGFASDPPNAVLVTPESSIAVELTDPTWDAPSTALHFTANVLHAGRTTHTPLPQGDLGASELFIDGALACNVNGTMWMFAWDNASAGFTAPTCANAAAALTPATASGTATVQLAGDPWSCVAPESQSVVCRDSSSAGTTVSALELPGLHSAHQIAAAPQQSFVTQP